MTRRTLRGAGLAPYDEDASCPKCGHGDVSTSYERNAHCGGHAHPNNWCPTPTMEPDCCQAEHLHRTCRRCFFRWAEAVLGKGVYADV